MDKINEIFKQKFKRAMSIILAFTMIMTMFPAFLLPAQAETSVSNTNAAFKVTTYDTSVRIEVPYDSTATKTNYKVYMSKLSGLTSFSGVACVLNSNAFKPYTYALDGDTDAVDSNKTISIIANTTYYFYLVINDGVTASMPAKTDLSPKYWTSTGNYDISWYEASASSFNINTAKQLAGLSVLVNGLNGVSAVNFYGKTVHLTASIDMSSYLWTPIGSVSNPFMGTFDGGNYDDSSSFTGSNVIKGLHINNFNYQGLFGNSTNTIKNIGMVDGYIKGFDRVGSIVAYNSGTVDNCFNTGVVIGTHSWIGGITGQNAVGGEITNCYNTGNIISPNSIKIGGIAGENNAAIINSYNTGSITGSDNVAGIAGYAWRGVISNSYNTGSIIGTGNYIGGIAGSAAGIMVTNCYNMGTVQGVNETGGIVGGFVEGYDMVYIPTTIANSYNTGTIDGLSGCIGGIVGQLADGTIQNSYNKGKVNGLYGLSGSIAGSIYTFAVAPTIINCAYLNGTSDFGNAFSGDTEGLAYDAAGILAIVQIGTTNVWAASPTSYAVGGIFSASNPVNQGYPVLTSFGYKSSGGNDSGFDNGFSPNITIDSSTGAVTVTHSYGNGIDINPFIIRNIYQMDLIRDYSGAAFELAGNIDIAPLEYNKTQDPTGSWSPIGTSGQGLSGTFDGNGFSVSGIYIDSSSDYQGLFGTSDGTIKNIGVTSGYVKGNSSVGGLCGFSSTVQNSYNTGVVIATLFGGGITGNNNTKLENSYNTGSITGTDQQVGGVVGYIYSSSSMINNYNIGSVEAGYSVGGVVGVSSGGTITNNYNTGAVSGSATVGGVIGDSESTLSNCFNTGDVNCTNSTAGGVAAVSHVSLSNSYNTGAVSGNFDIGGITGQSLDCTISNSYNTGVVSGNDCIGGIAGLLYNATISNTYYYGCGQGVGSGTQDGTTPFAKLENSQVKIGETTAITEQTVFSDNFKSALGTDFNINYTKPYTVDPAGVANITGNNITGAAAGSTSINGTFTINQNSLTKDGFKGAAQQIIVKASMPLSVTKAVPTVTVSPISKSIVGDTITLNATLTDGISPTGTVTFKNGIDVIGTGTISGGAASLSYTITKAGSLSITAEYSGDANNQSAVSSTAATATVDKMQPALTLSANEASPGTYPNDVTFTAALSNVYSSVSGKIITFNVDGTNHTVATDSSGIATFTLTAPSVKDYTVSASYAGDTNNYDVTSSSLTYSVNKAEQADLTIGGVPGTITYGDNAFTITPTGGSGTGSITYAAQTGKENVVTVDSLGKVTIKGAGTAIITVTRNGDTNYNSISKDVTINVLPKELNATITPDNKVYDGGTSASIKGNIIYTGIVGSDDVYISGGTIKFSDKTAANGKTVTASSYSLSGTENANYSLNTITVNKANITPKTVTLLNTEIKDKAYDGTVAAEFLQVPSANGILSSDTASLTIGTPTFAGKDYSGTLVPVIFSSFSLQGADAGNYSLIQPSPTSAKINKKILNVSVSPVTINCGQQIPALQVLVNAGDFAAGESESNIAGFAKPSASQSYGSTITPVSNTPMAVTYSSGNATNNYEFNYNNSTQLTINSVNADTYDYEVIGSYSTSNNPTGWNKSDLTINPKNGYDLISKDGINWTSSLQVQTEGAKKSVTFKLKKSSDGTQTENTAIFYNLDKTAPTGTITIATNKWEKFINTISFGLFYNKTVDVKVTGSDSLSGVKTIEYQKVASENDYKINGTWTPYSAFSVSPDEKFIVYAKITDNAGNVTIINSEGIVVDDKAPAITINYASDNIWTTDANAKISAEVTENLAGIKEIYYTIDGGERIVAATNSFDITSLKDGNYVAQITATDYAGNTATKNVTVKKDTVAPTISVSGNTTNYIKNDKVKITAAAGVSGITKIEVQKDSGALTDITSSFLSGYNVTENGTYTFKITNGAGASKTAAITYDKIDNTKVVIDINSNGYTEGTWTNKEVTLNVTNTASSLGSVTYEVSTNGTDYKAFNGTYKIISDSSLTYYFRGTSASGVVSDVKTFNVKMDKTAPSGTITIGTKIWDKFNNTITFGLVYNQTVDVKVTGSDSLSGVKTIEYQKVASQSDYKPNGTWTPYSAFSVSPNERFIVYAKITDNAGNATIINSDGVVVEYKAPAKPDAPVKPADTPASPAAKPASPAAKPASPTDSPASTTPDDGTNALTKASLEDSKTGTKMDGVDKTIFDANSELVVIPIKDTLDKKTKALFAKGVTNAAKGKEIAQLYDIHLLLNGKKIQPNGKIKITLKLDKKTKEYKKLQVVYVADDGTVTIIPSEQKGDEISFETDHLSDYGIIGTPVTAAKHKTESNMMVWLYIILAIVLLLVIFIVWKRRKDKNQKME